MRTAVRRGTVLGTVIGAVLFTGGFAGAGAAAAGPRLCLTATVADTGVPAASSWEPPPWPPPITPTRPPLTWEPPHPLPPPAAPCPTLSCPTIEPPVQAGVSAHVVPARCRPWCPWLIPSEPHPRCQRWLHRFDADRGIEAGEAPARHVYRTQFSVPADL
jgi:hypothetical protein